MMPFCLSTTYLGICYLLTAIIEITLLVCLMRYGDTLAFSIGFIVPFVFMLVSWHAPYWVQDARERKVWLEYDRLMKDKERIYR